MEKQTYNLTLNINPRSLSILVFSFFFSWLLAFPFEGQILYALADLHQVSPHQLIFHAIAVHFAGLFLCGFIIKNMKDAKRFMLFAIAFCIAGSVVFFSIPLYYGRYHLSLVPFLPEVLLLLGATIFKNSH